MKKLLILAFGACVGIAGAQTVFDATAASGLQYWLQSTGGPPAVTNLEGQNFQMNTSNATLGTMDIDYVSTAAASYNDVRLMVTFFSTGNLTYSGGPTTAEFPSILGSTVTFDLGAQTLGTLGTSYSATGLSLSAAGAAVSGNTFGAQFCWLTDSGSGLVAATGIQTLKNFAAPAAGSNPYNTYQMTFGSAVAGPGATTSATSLLESNYFYTGSAAQNLAVKFTAAAVPEPASMAVLGIGAAAMLRRRRSKKA